jgi:hypothetical protein
MLRRGAYLGSVGGWDKPLPPGGRKRGGTLVEAAAACQRANPALYNFKGVYFGIHRRIYNP